MELLISYGDWLLRTKVAKGIPRHYKVPRGFLELPTMMANGRVQQGCGLSFDALPPNVPLSSIWVDGDSEGSEGSGWTEGSSGGTTYVDFRLRKHTWSSERISTEENISGSWKTGIGSETIMETEIEQEVCDAKWNGTGIRDRGSERGMGTGNMKQANIGNMKCMGEWNQEWGYEWISRNDKVGDNRLNRARPEDHRRLHAGSEARPELGRWLGA